MYYVMFKKKDELDEKEWKGYLENGTLS